LCDFSHKKGRRKLSAHNSSLLLFFSLFQLLKDSQTLPTTAMSAAVMQENVAPVEAVAADVHGEEMECGPMPIEKLQVRDEGERESDSASSETEKKKVGRRIGELEV